MEQIRTIDEKITNALNINKRLHGTLKILATTVGDCPSELESTDLQQCLFLFEQLSEAIGTELEESRGLISKAIYRKEYTQ